MAAHSSGDEDMITGINVIPLVDIVLVLLIVFMVTATFIATPSIQVDLPKAATGEPTEISRLSLALASSGELYLNGEIVDDAQLKAFIQSELAEDRELQAIISADREASHGSVIRIIDLIKTEGVSKFAINVQP